jgi:hypothetical protein
MKPSQDPHIAISHGNVPKSVSKVLPSGVLTVRIREDRRKASQKLCNRGQNGLKLFRQNSWEGRLFLMIAAHPETERAPRVSQVIAEALVRRQGPLRIASRAARLGCSPMLTRTLVVACSATALDTTGITTRRED